MTQKALQSVLGLRLGLRQISGLIGWFLLELVTFPVWPLFRTGSPQSAQQFNLITLLQGPGSQGKAPGRPAGLAGWADLRGPPKPHPVIQRSLGPPAPPLPAGGGACAPAQ